MKKLLLLALAACLPFTAALAQYEIFYGTLDGTAMSVGINKVIDVPVWIKTDGANLVDSVAFLHNPLASNDAIIVVRSGGALVPPFIPYGSPTIPGWDDLSFLPPDADAGGFTNQSIFGFSEVSGPAPFTPPVNTNGLPLLLGYFRMTTANDPGLIGTTPCPFQEGDQTINHTHLWGNQFGTVQWVPIQHYSCLYFSPNQPPEWTSDPADVNAVTCAAEYEVSFALSGTDVDVDNTLHITGPYGFDVSGTGGVVAGVFTYVFTADFNGTLTFNLTDGTETLPLDVVVNVDVLNTEVPLTGTLEIGCVDNFPGGTVLLPINLDNSCLVGGFELLINYDPTALSFVPSGTDWTLRTNDGNEYHNQILNPVGLGTVRFVWVADINNGVPGVPMGAGSGAILWLTFHISSDLPFGMVIPVEFLITDYTDNTISDETGYDFVHPTLVNGCVRTVNPDDLKGDPNMNCVFYEIADAVLVAQRLIEGYGVWATDDGWGMSPDCSTDTHYDGNDPAQEAAADLNNNGFADVADLVRFINIINGFVFPKLDPATGTATISMGNGAVTINSGLEVGAALVRINGDITATSANGMDMLVSHANGITSVLVYSLAGNRISAGSSTLFTYTGEGSIVEVSASDAYGRLLDSAARPVLPTQFAVQQNYPNPFNAKTLINFDLPVQSDVTISIYNIAGQLVETINGNYEAGHQQVTWNASDVASGVYFAKVATGDNAQTVKMTMLK